MIRAVLLYRAKFFTPGLPNYDRTDLFVYAVFFDLSVEGAFGYTKLCGRIAAAAFVFSQGFGDIFFLPVGKQQGLFYFFMAGIGLYENGGRCIVISYGGRCVLLRLVVYGHKTTVGSGLHRGIALVLRHVEYHLFQIVHVLFEVENDLVEDISF